MIQILAALAVAIWFFRSARAVGKSGVGWALAGIVAVIAPSVPWMLFARAAIFPSLFRSDLEGPGLGFVAFVVASIGVLFGLAIAYWLHSANLRPDPSNPGAQAGGTSPGLAFLRTPAGHLIDKFEFTTPANLAGEVKWFIDRDVPVPLNSYVEFSGEKYVVACLEPLKVALQSPGNTPPA